MRVVAIAVALALVGVAAVMPGVRRHFIQDIITWDAPPTEPVALPGTKSGTGMSTASRVRVVLIDGLGTETAKRLSTWQSLCRQGIRLGVDVGFPTVSLPVEVSLWTGLTQQQTGIMFRSDRPLVPPLDRRGIPARVPNSIAVAEHHGYIVRSLGFAVAEPAAADGAPSKDKEPDAWAKVWQARAREAVASSSRLAFVHILRVDAWGHRKGGDSTEYETAATEADAILAELHAAAPDARWFLLSDHGHLPTGGHGGEDRALRHVEHCVVGPGIAPATAPLVHLVDVSRMIADSLEVALDKRSPARPLSIALKTPLAPDAAVPGLPVVRGVAALLLLALGVAASVWSVRRWWLAPLWFVVACALLVIVRGAPTMSMPMVYAKEDVTNLLDSDKRLMMRTWLVALPIAGAAAWFGLARGLSLVRVLAAQLALPIAALAAALTACGGWGALFGAEVSPMVPHYTAMTLVLMLIVSQGTAAVALAVLARSVQQAFGRRRSSETTRSEP